MSALRAGGADRRDRLRGTVLARSDKCALCGKPGADTVDHVVPRSRGGTDAVSNLRPAHADCSAARTNVDTSTRDQFAAAIEGLI